MARGIGSKPPPTTPAELDLALDRLDAGAPRLAALPPGERARLLRAVGRRFHELAPRFVALDAAAKGIDAESARAGEPALEGPVIVLRFVTELAATFEGKRRLGSERVREVDGRTVVDALPLDPYDSVVFRGFRGEVWLDRAVAPGAVATDPRTLGAREAEIALVLGAGNVASIGVVDALGQCFVEGRACVLKLSPVNDYQGPLLELAFAPLVKEGFLALAYGGADVGAYLAAHPAIDAIHVTGAYETHEAIVWGADAEQRRANKARGEPICRKPVTSELGNVSPAVVVPGAWTDREIDHAARSIAGSFAFNAGFNCNATKLVVTPRGTDLRERLLARLRAVLAEIPLRDAYYPGAAAKYERFTTSGGRVEKLGVPARTASGAAPSGTTAWALVTELEPSMHPACFEHEPFCAVLSEVALGGSDPLEFMAAVAPFLNERVWGTLNAMLLVPEAVTGDPTLARGLEATIRALRYGSVGVNVWPAVAYGLGTLPWGGHPSGTLADVQSGLGFGHNSLLLEHVEKSVVRAPLVQTLPKPFWYPGYRTLDRLARRLVDFQADPSPLALARVAFEALRG
ncbi:MAG TPA: aldehyde dehydrogenase family protein [Polyangiaceae bacterium]|nr:aldehyde dehydrogenase family protein [Polyangiaceae bacterium]